MSKQDRGIPGGWNGLTREEFLRRGAGTAIALGATGLIAACGGSSSATTTATTSTTAGTPKRGGVLKIGAPENSPTYNEIDPHTLIGWSGTLTSLNVYENLVVRDRNWMLANVLAEELTWEKPLSWLLRLQPGVTFHSGKPLTVDDVIFSIHRMVTTPGANSSKYFSSVDMNAFQKLDARTMRITLTRPDSTIADAFTDYSSVIVPAGFSPAKPDGTGPFKLTSVVAGETFTMDRNPDYWQHGLPYVDQLVVYDLSDPSARTNALLSGEVHAIAYVPLGQVAVVKGRSDLQILESPNGGNNAPMTMASQEAPFNDSNVRLAMKLIADRPQMVSDALSGHGSIGNDVFSPNDAEYNSSLPQHQQDIEQAKSLLSKAGVSNLNVNLVVAEVQDGLTAACELLAQNAKAAGVTMNVQTVTSSVLFGPKYTHWPFAVDFWGNRPYLIQVGSSMVPGAAFNETQWPDTQDLAKYMSLYQQARSTRSESVRTEVIHAMQMIDWERGGSIIWAFCNKVDAISTKITGLQPTKNNVPLDRGNFKEVYFV